MTQCAMAIETFTVKTDPVTIQAHIEEWHDNLLE